MGLPNLSAAAAGPFISVTGEDLMEIISISSAESNRGAILTVKSVGKMTVEKAMFLEAPPRIIYDLFYDGMPFSSVARSVNNLYLENIRVGYHPNKIRLVLDMKGLDIPVSRYQQGNNELIIRLGEESQGAESGAKIKNVKETNPTVYTPSVSEENNGPRETENNSAGYVKEATSGISDASVSKYLSQSNPDLLLEKMTQVETNDTSEETALFLKGVEAYKHQRWPEAEKSLQNLIKTYSKGRYSEKAYFLLAKSIDQLYSQTTSEHFSVIKSHYEDAIYRFPASIFVPDTLLSMGNLRLKVKNFDEAIVYFNLVIEKNTGDATFVKAMIQKGNLLFQKGKYTEALSVYEHIIKNYGGTFAETEAKIGAAKALFEINSFDKSINLLTRLAQSPENIYRYPEIYLYLGYNYYQKKDYAMTRESLFRYYNVNPDSETGSLVLSKIGDSYRAEGFANAATKIYQLVLFRYPQTEGALISLTRLAEEQESGELKITEGAPVPFKIIDEVIASPNEIYEELISGSISNNNNSPMAEYALLKLAIIHRKMKSYRKSLDIFIELLEKYPKSKLLPETIYALSDTVEAVLKDEGEEEYTKILNIYQKQKESIQRLAPPRTFLAVAIASQRLGLQDMAAELFRKADALLPEEKKPEELLFYLGKYFLENGQPENGLEKLESLIKKYPSGRYSAKAYHLKGGVFQKNKEYAKAVEMFSKALKSRPGLDEGIYIMADKARALTESGFKEEGLAVARYAEQSLAESQEQSQPLYQEVGDLYLQIGRPADALLLLNNALSFEKEEKKSIKLKLSIARCYEALNKKSDYIALYNQIIGLNDPLWSLVAKERMEAIDFEETLRKADKSKNRR
ncbi:MAG: tetratricopeptide repeat protein [Proteobacteria bacterium]|nr:tetratricopeptide repeat protein [Pseudomonadota bacterium]